MTNQRLILLLMGLSSSVTALKSFLGENTLLTHELEDKDRQWISIDSDTEFMPADEGISRRLGASHNRYATNAFVDGGITYDENSQAWRYLGFMIDCNVYDDDLYDDEGGGGGSQDGTGEGCTRYIVWAAYVDLKYEGGGIAEYQYWDTNKNSWNANACKYNQLGNNARCAKMDCHKSNTHFSLLGIFKHKDYDEWIGQLFKHEGYCVWTNHEYRFMNSNQDALPNGCTLTGTYTNDYDPIYYDLKPTSNGGMTLGLYTDTRCVIEYKKNGKNDPINIENVLGNVFDGANGNYYYEDDVGGDISSFAEGLALWESGWDRWRVCQPCITYDINNVGHFTDDDASKGSSYADYNNGYGYYTDFDCYDKAGATNVNQCMKFMSQTVMKTASYSDLAFLLQQGTTADVQVNTFNKDSWKSMGVKNNGVMTIFLFVASCGILYMGVNLLQRAKREPDFKASFNIKEPLVFA